MTKVIRCLKEKYPEIYSRYSFNFFSMSDHWFFYSDLEIYLEFYSYRVNNNWIYINGNKDRCSQLIHCTININTGEYGAFDSSFNPEDLEIFEKIRYLGVSNAESFIYQT